MSRLMWRLAKTYCSGCRFRYSGYCLRHPRKSSIDPYVPGFVVNKNYDCQEYVKAPWWMFWRGA
jgi:hypothetical protein